MDTLAERPLIERIAAVRTLEGGGFPVRRPCRGPATGLPRGCFPPQRRPRGPLIALTFFARHSPRAQRCFRHGCGAPRLPRATSPRHACGVPPLSTRRRGELHR